MKNRKINIYNKMLLTLGIILTYSVSIFSQHVDHDFDHGIDFRKYKTYGFTAGTCINDGQKSTENDMMDQRVYRAVGSQLNAKGLRQSTDNPDLLITYTAGAKKKT